MDTFSYLLGKKASGGGGGGSAEPNIFVQTTEPTKKDGIWVESDLTHNATVIDENVFASGEWDNIAYGDIINANVNSFVYNNDLYIWDSGYRIYKLNKQTNLFENINVTLHEGDTAIGSFSVQDSSCCVVGNYVICICTSGTQTKGYYKIDLINKVAYSNTTIPFYVARRCPFVNYNGTLFLIGAKTSSTTANASTEVFTYDITSDTFTKRDNFPSGFINNYEDIGYYQACVYGDRILIIDTRSGKRVFLNPDSYTYSTPESLPANMDIISNQSATSLVTNGSDVYFLTRTKVRKYDVINNTYTDFATYYDGNELNRILGLGIMNNKIYFPGGSWYVNGSSSSTNLKTVKSLSLVSKQYNNGDLVIRQNDVNYGAYGVNLIDTDFTGKLLVPVSNVYLYDNNELKTNLPTYIGNGTSWTKIKG